MDIFDEDLTDLFNTLSKKRFIIIGDIASNFHAQTKFSLFIEIWIDNYSAELLSIKEELIQRYNFDIIENKNLDTLKFITSNLLIIELTKSVKGLENYSFDEAFQMASIADIFDLKIPFLHINQLITSKKAANRSKDQIDVMKLAKIKKLRGEE